MDRLIVKNADLTTQAHLLASDIVIIGRQPYCDVVLANGAVSREHAKMTKTVDGWTIEDLQSRNGVWVNGKRVGERRVLLSHQDSIQIGEATLIFWSEPTPATQVARGAARADSFAWREDELDVSSIKSQVALAPSDSSMYVGSGKSRFRSLEEYEREIALLEERLRVMLDFARILGKAEDVVDLAPRFLTNLLRLFPKADAACVVAPSEEKSERAVWKLVGYKRRDETSSEPFQLSRAIIRHVVATRSAILSDYAPEDSRFDASESIVRSQIQSVMATPIYDSVNNKLLGVIQIDSRGLRRRFDHNELKMLVVVANQVAVYWENQFYRDALVAEKVASREMQVANQVQRGFLPSEPPKLDGYEFFDFYRPAKFVGGDYFDYISLPDGRLAVILGDVAGKGISASLLMAKLSSEARYGLALEKTLSAAVARLNRLFSENHWGDRFITLVLLVLEPSTGVVRVFNAGHLYPIVSKTDGSVERVGEGFNSFPLGVVLEAEYPEYVYQLQEGEAISIMSDGLPDAMNASEEQFTEARVLKALQNSDGFDAASLGRRLVSEVREFAGAQTQTDDQCLVVFRRALCQSSSEREVQANEDALVIESTETKTEARPS